MLASIRSRAPGSMNARYGRHMRVRRGRKREETDTVKIIRSMY